jgi:hypothetical protein
MAQVELSRMLTHFGRSMIESSNNFWAFAGSIRDETDPLQNMLVLTRLIRHTFVCCLPLDWSLTPAIALRRIKRTRQQI